jgi:hypothetical protein
MMYWIREEENNESMFTVGIFRTGGTAKEGVSRYGNKNPRMRR